MNLLLAWLLGRFFGQHVDNPGQTAGRMSSDVDNPGQTPM